MKLTQDEIDKATYVASSTHALDAMCTCGKRWGAHNGSLCPSRDRVFALAQQPTPMYVVRHKHPDFDETFVFLGALKSPADHQMYDTYFSSPKKRVACVGSPGLVYVHDYTSALSHGGIYGLAAREAKRRFFDAPQVRPDASAQPAPQAKPATLAESTDPRDIAMMKRDGPAKTVAVPPQAVVLTPLVSSAKPCPFAAFTSPDMVKSDHRIAGRHGSAHLHL